jgi:hypothetical protein
MKFLFILLLLFCRDSRKDSSLEIQNAIQLLIYSNATSALVCTVPVEANIQTASCKTNLQNEPSSFRCNEYFPDSDQIENSKDLLDLMYRGLSVIELSDRNIKSKLQNSVFISAGLYNTYPVAELKKIQTDIGTSIKAEKYNYNQKHLNSEEEIKFIHSTMEDKSNNFLFFSPESVSIAYTENNKDEKFITTKSGIETFRKELVEKKEEYKSCRQPISAFFKSASSSFQNCKDTLMKSIKESAGFKPLFQVKLNSTKKTIATSQSLEYYLPKFKEINSEDLIKLGNKYCKLTIGEILDLGIKKKDSANLCYSISFHSVILDLLEIQKVKIQKRELIVKEMSVSKIFFPNCN